MLVAVLQIVLLSYVGLAALMYFMQDRMIFLPSREPGPTPAALGLPFEPLTLKTADGESIAAWHTPAPHGANRPGLVLIFHGNAGNISHRLDYLRMFHELGHASLIIDYRGYGASSGTPSEQGVYRDADAAWRHATTSLGHPRERIVVFGESLGGAVAARLASTKQPAALVVASSFTSVPDLAAEIYPWLPVRLLAKTKLDTRGHLQAVTSAVLVIHSRGDDIVPFAHGEALYRAARAPKRFLEIQGGHNDGFVFSQRAWIGELAEFLRTAIPGPAAQPAPGAAQ